MAEMESFPWLVINSWSHLSKERKGSWLVQCSLKSLSPAHTVQASAEVSVTSNPLSDARFLFILLVSLSLKDVAIKGDHMTIYVAKRKND